MNSDPSPAHDEEDYLPMRSRGGERLPASDMESGPADREVTLNTGTVLVLFFTLALICAVFFGFGYSMGRKSAVSNQTAVTAAPAGDDGPAVTTVNKPSSGSAATAPVPSYVPPGEAGAKPATAATVTTPTRTAPAVPPGPTAATSEGVAPAVAAGGAVTYVQVAAVSHQEDAEVLGSALKRRGYEVLNRSDPNDKLIHVQIGPFTDRKAAEAMRQKLLADGYNAFLK